MGNIAPHGSVQILCRIVMAGQEDKKGLQVYDPCMDYGGKLVPKSKVDYAFLLHGLYHLKQTGTMTIVLLHGALFRGAVEGTIRKILLKNGSIYAVIGLPSNMFYNISIPTELLF